jgi:hypothetical protein
MAEYARCIQRPAARTAAAAALARPSPRRTHTPAAGNRVPALFCKPNIECLLIQKNDV